MLEVSNEYQNNRWFAYDRRFRQLAASQPSWKWSNTDSTLWSLAFTGQAKASSCKHCFSLFHQSSDCEFAPAYSSSHAQASAHRRFICHQWNEQPAQRCMFPNCRYEHVCYNNVPLICQWGISIIKLFSVQLRSLLLSNGQDPYSNETDTGWCNISILLDNYLFLVG